MKIGPLIKIIYKFIDFLRGWRTPFQFSIIYENLITQNVDIVRHIPKVSSQCLEQFPSNKLLQLGQTEGQTDGNMTRFRFHNTCDGRKAL